MWGGQDGRGRRLQGVLRAWPGVRAPLMNYLGYRFAVRNPGQGAVLSAGGSESPAVKIHIFYSRGGKGDLRSKGWSASEPPGKEGLSADTGGGVTAVLGPRLPGRGLVGDVDVESGTMATLEASHLSVQDSRCQSDLSESFQRVSFHRKPLALGFRPWGRHGLLLLAHPYVWCLTLLF